MKVVFLDTGILGKVTHPRGSPEHKECIEWLLNLLRAGVRVCIPEVCDYELRRDYLRRDATAQIVKLDALKGKIHYVPIKTASMLKAAALWAEARKRGRPTADDKALDGDVILGAQALLDVGPGEQLVVATTNVAHLSEFVPASEWHAVRA